MNGNIKKSRSIYVIGAITIGIIALLAVYFILIATGVISAEPVRLVLSSASRTAEYNGVSLTDDGWQLESGELKDGHVLTVTVTGARTEVGESDNVFSATVHDENGYDVTDSYGIKYKFGRLAVTPRKIVVASASAEKTYDGEPLTARSCAVLDGSLVDGHELEYHVNGSLTAAGKTDNTFAATVTDGERDVSYNYDIEYLFGTLYVHGEMLNIVTESAEKVYDGTPLTAEKWTLTSGRLAQGHTLSVTVLGEQKDIGSSDNVATCVVTAADGSNVTDMYEAVFAFGTLTVTPVVIVVETCPAYKVYDGTPLVCDAWRVVNDSTLANDTWYQSGRTVAVGEYSITASVIGSITDVGVVDNTAVFVAITKDGAPADGVGVEFRLGTLTVAPRPLTIRSGTAGKKYDGTPLVCNEYDIVSATQVAEGQDLTVMISGTITFVGITDNTVAEVKITSGGNDVTRNYDIRVQEGKLAILDENGGTGGNGGGGSGDGSGDVDDSGNISGGNTGSGQGEPVTVMRIRSDIDGSVYLRQMSYGDYEFDRWGQAERYGVTIDRQSVRGGTVRYSANYLTGAALGSAGVAQGRLEVRPIKVSQYYLPYYLSTTELAYAVQSSDVANTDNDGEYSAYYYRYDYIADGGAKLAGVDLGELAAYESAYRDHVYEHYTSIPDSTREYMRGIVAEQGFDGLDVAQAVSAVARYVRGCAKYNAEYDRALDGENDVAVAFLDKYKEGICQHYATAATLIFRTLGIPARYTCGYTESARRNEWVDVTNKKAHAWTEVYIDGAGWVYVEVTGGGAGFDGNGDSSSSGIGNPDSPDKLAVKPFDVYVRYDGNENMSLVYERDDIQGLTALVSRGYRYEFTVVGKQVGLGIGTSRIETFKLFDASGNDVTNDFSIELSTGKLHIYMQEITVRTRSLQKTYDGTPLTDDGDGLECVGALLDGHSVGEITPTGRRTSVGRSSNTYEMSIVDRNGDDVTYMYKINRAFGSLTVTVRTLTIVAGSAVGYVNALGGKPLVCDEYIIDGGDGLADGDTLTVVISGEQIGVGRSENVVSDIFITNTDGADVTSNYKVASVGGTLTVLPGNPPAQGGA